jgi:L-lactate dehydrogenase complex protein LldE
MAMSGASGRGVRVGLMATCVVDLFRPTVGFAAAKLLEDAGCVVEVPTQTCCGQPAYNSGDRRNAREIALQNIETFEGYDYVVMPSGSCAGTMAKHYPDLFEDDPELHQRAQRFSAKCFELVSFLTDVLKVERVNASFPHKVTYHDSCSGLREMGVRDQPRKLLNTVEGLELVEMKDSDVCCGFGGTFAVKFGEISGEIVERKTHDITATGAPVLLAGDVGCLMNMAGRLQRQGKDIEVRHVAEVLAGMTDGPAIGEPREGAARAMAERDRADRVAAKEEMAK